MISVTVAYQSLKVLLSLLSSLAPPFISQFRGIDIILDGPPAHIAGRILLISPQQVWNDREYDFGYG
jgi:hypothetical protein